jgi:hypothetical protein
MAATVALISHHGAAGATETDVTNGTLRFKNADDSTVDTNNPLQIPAAGTTRSYVKQIGFKVTVAPTNNITSIVAYSDGSASATGWSGNIDIKAKASASYLDPTTNTTTALSGSPSSVFTYTSGSPLSLGAGPFTSTGRKGDYLQLQMEVGTGATPGTLASETITVQFDES